MRVLTQKIHAQLHQLGEHNMFEYTKEWFWNRGELVRTKHPRPYSHHRRLDELIIKNQHALDMHRINRRAL